MQTKVCTKCKTEKALEDFYKKPQSKCGYFSECKKCNIERGKSYYTKHDTEIIEKHRVIGYAKKIEYKEKAIDWQKEYYKKNKIKIDAKNKKFATENKPVIRAILARRRAAKLKQTAKWANFKVIKSIYAECDLKSKETGILHHVDHIIPLQGKFVSGLHVEYNLRIIPAKDNLQKHNKLVEELL